MKKTTWLYVMAQRGGGWAIKIGIAMDPRARLRQVQTGSPLPLYLAHTVGPFTLANARELEATAHDVFGEFRMVGEWFRMTPDEGANILNIIWERASRG